MVDVAEKTASPVFEEVFQNIRKAAEANLKMQQEVLSQWSSLWPGIPTPQSAWVGQMQNFRKQSVGLISDLVRKHREVIDRQYKVAVESLDAALSISDAAKPAPKRRHIMRKGRSVTPAMGASSTLDGNAKGPILTVRVIAWAASSLGLRRNIVGARDPLVGAAQADIDFEAFGVFARIQNF